MKYNVAKFKVVIVNRIVCIQHGNKQIRENKMKKRARTHNTGIMKSDLDQLIINNSHQI